MCKFQRNSPLEVIAIVIYLHRNIDSMKQWYINYGFRFIYRASNLVRQHVIIIQIAVENYRRFRLRLTVICLWAGGGLANFVATDYLFSSTISAGIFIFMYTNVRIFISYRNKILYNNMGDRWVWGLGSNVSR